jgi:hypothetical protein
MSVCAEQWKKSTPAVHATAQSPLLIGIPRISFRPKSCAKLRFSSSKEYENLCTRRGAKRVGKNGKKRVLPINILARKNSADSNRFTARTFCRLAARSCSQKPFLAPEGHPFPKSIWRTISTAKTGLREKHR